MQAAPGAALIDLVDDGRLSFAQARVIALCAIIALLDGFDTQAIGFVAPVISAQWNVPVAGFGPVFALGLFGGLLGAILFGSVADSFGRRFTLLVTVTVFAAGSLATALATSLTDLTIYRFATGVGLGGAMPSIIALASEYAPPRLRTTLVAAMFCGFPLGAVLGAIVSAQLMGRYGWTSVFLAGGMLPLLLLPVLVLRLPESVGWLLAHGQRAKADRVLAGMSKQPLPADAHARLETPPKASFASLFMQGRAAGSLLLALIFFISLLLVYLLVSWVPAMAVAAGHSQRAGVIAAALLNFSGIIGSIAIGVIGDRRGTYGTVGSAYVLGALGVGAIALSGAVGGGIFAFCAVAGLFCIGAQVCAVSIASQYYPLEARGTGIGWSMGAGRLGAICGPLIGATLIGSGASAGLYWLVAWLSAGAGAAVLVMGLLYTAKARP
jgi:AAHS family 4-hydroxybenzoate transporter-like MFS transporter